MAIIAGVNIPDNQRLEIALTSIYGIGRTTSKKIVGERNSSAICYHRATIQPPYTKRSTPRSVGCALRRARLEINETRQSDYVDDKQGS